MSSKLIARYFLLFTKPVRFSWSLSGKYSLFSSRVRNSCSLCRVVRFETGVNRFLSTSHQLNPDPSSITVVRPKLSRRGNFVFTGMAVQLAKPFTIYVTECEESSENPGRRIRLSFRFQRTTDRSADCMLNFERENDGLLRDTLTRIRVKLMSLGEDASKKKRRKKKEISDAALESIAQGTSEWTVRVITTDGTEVDESVTNEKAFLTPGAAMMVNDEKYTIVGPIPAVTKLEVDILPIVGFPVLPSLNLTEGGSPRICQYFWLISDDAEAVPVEPRHVSCDHDEISGAIHIHQIDGWTVRSTEATFVPQEQDIGKSISLIVVPRNDKGVFGLPRIWTAKIGKADQSDIFRKGVVIEARSQMIWTGRHQACRETVPEDTFRCVSYNILADLYMNLNLPQEQLYFPYCPKQYQSHVYRYPLLLKELDGYQGDLYCLQEVDSRNYIRYLEPYLVQRGWRGIHRLKGGIVNEGSAIFYRPEKFELVSSDDAVLADLLSEERDDFADLVQVAKQNDHVWNIFLSRPAVLQVAVLRCHTLPNSFICVGTTHLHFKPHHTHIRLLQAATGYRHLINVATGVSQQYPNATVGIIFCGDFNSTPSSGAYQLLQTGNIHAQHDDWRPKVEEGNEEVDEGETEETLALKGIDLSFPKRLRTACTMEYTTLTHKFQGMLDHIFISDELEVSRVIDEIPHELVTKYTALPSPVCPSDHLPLICEIKFQ